MKTLKDLNQGMGLEIDGRTYSNGRVEIVDLRNAAIEWIKELNKGGYDNNIEVKSVQETAGKGMELILKTESDIVVRWIKHFFNISEEDLQ